MSDVERLKVAAHEAGHWCAFRRLQGVTPDLLTIRPSASHRGACIGGLKPVHLADRAEVEAAIVGLLAGRAAEDLIAPRLGYVSDEPDDDERRASALAQSLAQLHPRDKELLERAEARPADEADVLTSDDREAFELSFQLTAAEASLHVAWLRAVARRFVVHDCREIAALAHELVRETVLSGAKAAAIVDAIEEVPRAEPLVA